jgi:hypothetical protein
MEECEGILPKSNHRDRFAANNVVVYVTPSELSIIYVTTLALEN